jgi:hypothetical protein
VELPNGSTSPLAPSRPAFCFADLAEFSSSAPNDIDANLRIAFGFHIHGTPKMHSGRN